MAIRLKVLTNQVKLKVVDGDKATLHASEGVPIYPSSYSGATEVTPSEEEQTLSTANLMLFDDIKVNPIPSNYGLITYNGTTITVS